MVYWMVSQPHQDDQPISHFLINLIIPKISNSTFSQSCSDLCLSIHLTQRLSNENYKEHSVRASSRTLMSQIDSEVSQRIVSSKATSNLVHSATIAALQRQFDVDKFCNILRF